MPRTALSAVLLVLCATSTAIVVAQAPDSISAGVYEALRRGRDRAGVAPLDRRAELDRAARARAGEVAARPHAERMGPREPLRSVLLAAGVKTYRRAREHVDMKRGYARPTAAFVETWQSYESAWAAAMDPSWDAVGVATVESDDGFLVLVALLIEELQIDRDVAALEHRVVEAVNEVREQHGLPPLEPEPAIADVARGHSEEMVRLGFFAHSSPISGQPADRVEAAGIRYRRLAENIQSNNDGSDPVRAAVRSWMGSRPHRRNILDGRFTHTGVGVAVTEDGMYYFTQLFLLAWE